MGAAADAVQLPGGGYGYVSGCPPSGWCVTRRSRDEGTSHVQRIAMARQLLKEGNAGVVPGRRGRYVYVLQRPSGAGGSGWRIGRHLASARRLQLVDGPPVSSGLVLSYPPDRVQRP